MKKIPFPSDNTAKGIWTAKLRLQINNTWWWLLLVYGFMKI
jgi:hypothetical protein